MKKYSYSVLIGRFQPYHLAHHELLKEALSIGNKVIVVLGSHNKAPDIKNPWGSAQRRDMIRLSLSSEEYSRVSFIFMRDYLYNDNLWLADLQQKVNEETEYSEDIALVGHEHDKSSFYLRLFPQWAFIPVKNIDKHPHATKIRQLYFTHDNEYKNHVPVKTIEYMEEFKQTSEFKILKDEFDFLKEYHAKWEGSPFAPIFHTVDSVVFKSGHVLLVRRKGKLGKGLLALPGGFLNQDEKLQDGAIRELKEETAIKLSKDELASKIADQKVFDLPARSLRGRTITSAFLINLGSGPLPQVKGTDDAEKAMWMPLSEVMQRESEFFEDHWHIITHFFNRY
jgi:bifunctional NMN adenylyltransferase/nudix hydrolase